MAGVAGFHSRYEMTPVAGRHPAQFRRETTQPLAGHRDWQGQPASEPAVTGTEERPVAAGPAVTGSNMPMEAAGAAAGPHHHRTPPLSGRVCAGACRKAESGIRTEKGRNEQRHAQASDPAEGPDLQLEVAMMTSERRRSRTRLPAVCLPDSVHFPTAETKSSAPVSRRA